MNYQNIISQIKAYISKYKEDQSECWEHEHTPYLTKALSNLNQAESNQLSREIFNWDDFHLYCIADPIIFCSNEHLNTSLLYVKIFSKIKTIEYLEYLVENEIPHITPHYYTRDKIEQLSPYLIANLKQNIVHVMTVKSNDWNISLRKVLEFLHAQEIA